MTPAAKTGLTLVFRCSIVKKKCNFIPLGPPFHPELTLMLMLTLRKGQRSTGRATFHATMECGLLEEAYKDVAMTVHHAERGFNAETSCVYPYFDFGRHFQNDSFIRKLSCVFILLHYF